MIKINKKIIKDNKLRLKFFKKEILCKFYNIILNNRYLDEDNRLVIYKKKLKLKNTLVKINNRCILTGRNRSTMSEFKISRLMFKYYVTRGLIIGIKKNN